MSTPQTVPNRVATNRQARKVSMKKISKRSFFDFESFDTVVAGKEYDAPSLPPGATMEQILSVVGNDAAKLAALVEVGLQAQANDAAYGSLEGWFALDENKAITAVPYVPSGADASDVNDMKRTLARTIFGYSVDDSKEVKDAKMQSALEMIKNTPAIRDGLRNRAK